MPLLFSLGQHPALEAVQRQCPDHTFLDDTYLVSKTQEVREGYVSVERELWRHAKIRVHEGKTHIWNLAGIKPEICDVLQRAAAAAKPGARATEEQGIKVLGALVGHRDFVRKHLERILEQHEVLLNGIPRRAVGVAVAPYQLGLITSCESCDQSVFWSLPGLMMRTCGEDCAQSLKFPPLRVRGMPET